LNKIRKFVVPLGIPCSAKPSSALGPAGSVAEELA
jgi:hypothetical protein